MKRLVASLLLIVAMVPAAVLVTPAQTTYAGDCGGGTIFFPRWFDGLCSSQGEIMSPGGGGGGTQGTQQSFGKWVTILALNLVSMLLYAVGYVSLAFVIYGGFKYMTSGDSSNGTAAARKTITNAIIGLVISILAVAIVRFVTVSLY